MDRKEKKYSRFEYRVPRVGEGMGKGWVMIGEERLDKIGRVSKKDIRKGEIIRKWLLQRREGWL